MPQIFPKWINTATKVLPFALLGSLCFVVFVFWYWFSPKHLEVGYQPKQPIPFSHKLHADDLGIDCMLCHNMADKSPHAGVPPTQTCLNCHEHLANKNTLRTSGISQSWSSGVPIAWQRVHQMPDYVYFSHVAHVSAGVGCVSCHGAVDQMEKVRQEKPLSMSWCLECHRNPAPHLRPVQEVTNMNYHQSESYKKMALERAKNMKAPVESCSGCHR